MVFCLSNSVLKFVVSLYCISLRYQQIKAFSCFVDIFATDCVFWPPPSTVERWVFCGSGVGRKLILGGGLRKDFETFIGDNFSELNLGCPQTWKLFVWKMGIGGDVGGCCCQRYGLTDAKRWLFLQERIYCLHTNLVCLLSFPRKVFPKGIREALYSQEATQL